MCSVMALVLQVDDLILQLEAVEAAGELIEVEIGAAALVFPYAAQAADNTSACCRTFCTAASCRSGG